MGKDWPAGPLLQPRPMLPHRALPATVPAGVAPASPVLPSASPATDRSAANQANLNGERLIRRYLLLPSPG